MSTTPTDSPPAGPQKVTNCHRVRATTRRMCHLVMVTAQRAVSAAFCCAWFQPTSAREAFLLRTDLTPPAPSQTPPPARALPAHASAAANGFLLRGWESACLTPAPN